MTPIRIVVADDHPFVLEGIEQLFRAYADVEIVALCRNGNEAVEAVRRLSPDVLILDLLMPARDGLGVLHTIQREELRTRVILLTAVSDDEQLLEGIRLGARGVVLKESAPQVLAEAVRLVHDGGEWIEKTIYERALRRALEKEAHGASVGSLTRREAEIVRMVADGLRNRAIAEKLFISEGTVKVHLHNIYEKLGVSGRFDLIAAARRRGLV